MLDASGLPQTGRGNFQRFTSLGGTNEWQTWIKPRNTTMVGIKCIGPGSGGGGGFSAAAGSARGGGGGGASGRHTDLIIPAYLLPDVLYVCVPAGGKGGASGVAGTAAVRTRISLVPNDITTFTNLICVTGQSDIGGGGAGTGAAAGSGGAVGSGSILTDALGHSYALSFVGGNGQSGAAGGVQTGAVGVAIAIGGSSLYRTGGAGGGGTGTANTDFAGGAITGLGQIPGIAGGLAAGGNGNSGFFSEGPVQFFSLGGTGGGSNGATGVGGAGGRGNIGSGGGGGGGGVTGGAGGDGGPGLALLWAW